MAKAVTGRFKVAFNGFWSGASGIFPRNPCLAGFGLCQTSIVAVRMDEE
jgi:hypothetical protein